MTGMDDDSTTTVSTPPGPLRRFAPVSSDPTPPPARDLSLLDSLRQELIAFICMILGVLVLGVGLTMLASLIYPGAGAAIAVVYAGVVLLAIASVLGRG